MLYYTKKYFCCWGGGGYKWKHNDPKTDFLLFTQHICFHIFEAKCDLEIHSKILLISKE